MPIVVTASPIDRMVVGVASGEVTMRDLAECFLQMLNDDLLRYRKIIELVGGTPALTNEELSTFAALARDGRAHGPRGALAVVADDKWSEFAHAFAAMAGADRPVKVCRSIHDARTWLAEQRASD